MIALAGVGCGTPPDDDEPGPWETLVRTDELPPDEACPGGSVVLLVGRDDGAGDGTAGDGALQDGEVQTRQTICQGTASPPVPDSYLPIGIGEGPAGTHRFQGHGGDGVRDDGASGGRLEARLFPPSARGHVGVLGTGSVDVAVVVPDGTGLDLGPNPLVVDGDLLVIQTSDPNSVPEGQVFLSDDAPAQLLRAGSPGSVSGIHVLPGARLVLQGTGENPIDLLLEGSVLLEGTLTTASAAGTPVSVRLQVERWVATTGSLVDLRGADATSGGRGGAGGAFTLVAWLDAPRRPFRMGSLLHEGAIDTRGGAGAGAGAGGDIRLDTYERMTVTGPLRAAGGDAAGSGSGGPGGTVSLVVQRGPLAVDAELDAHGGDGLSTAGRGGSLTVEAEGVTVAGSVTVDGGDVSGCASACNGAAAGSISGTSYGVPLTWVATVSGRGGSSVDTPGGVGGVGSTVTLGTARTLDRVPRSDDRSVLIAADLVLDGGDGVDRGAPSGSLVVTANGDDAPRTTIRLLGYAELSLLGGSGPADRGGEGGHVSLQHSAESNDSMGGGVVLAVPAALHGGHGRSGGAAGILRLEADLEGGEFAHERLVRLLAPVDAVGGSGTEVGGAGPQIVLRGSWGVELAAPVEGGGGAATFVSARGGAGGRVGYAQAPITLEALRGTVRLDADVVAPGGAAPAKGGDGASALVIAQGLVGTARVDLAGGDAARGDGGNGGTLVVVTGADGYDLAGADVSVAGGDGARDLGASGRVIVDGVDRTDELAP